MAADFLTAYQTVLSHEGGYINDPDDPGGETYKGVSRKLWSSWEGWEIIDRAKRKSGFPGNLEKETDLQELIKDFYRQKFWDSIQGNNINDQNVATSIFDFAVNAGVSTSASLVQLVVKTEVDGVIGKNTIEALNAFDTDHFLSAFTVAKIARYVTIVKKRPSSQKYFYGWVRRALGDI
jgi:lysozyme family protein